jgi:zinc protease
MRILRRAIFIGVLYFAAIASACSRPSVEAPAVTPKIAVEKHTLANGLDLLLVEDHRLPRVAVNTWFHVGPVNEVAGRTGFAHLFEHMMFQNSKHVPEDGFDKFLESAGGSDMNGTTEFDRTNYFETVPSNELELVLWLESDRMGYLLDNLTAESFKNQQDVVRNERRQSTEGQPFGIVEEGMYHTLFPKGHPYYADVIGSHEDIQAAKLADVRNFFKQYYSPNNASLAIVGDIDKAKTLALVEKYFGTLKRGPDVPPVQVKTPEITSERRLTVKDRVELPRLYMAWITPPIFTSGDAEADIAAQILGAGKSSRLYKDLIYEKQIAQDLQVNNLSLTLGSVFVIQATARKGTTLEALEKEIDAQLDSFRGAVPETTELDRARAAIETDMLFSLERNGSFEGIANRINTYNHHLKNPDYLAEDIGRYRKATASGIHDFAMKYLQNNARVVVYGMPGPQDLGKPVPTPAKSAERDRPESVNVDEAWRNQRPASGPQPALVIPAPVSFKLSNGLMVLLDRRNGWPVVTADLVIGSGSGANPPGKPGLASFTLDMLDEGTASRSSMEFASQLEQIGARLSASASRDYSSVVLGISKTHLVAGMSLLADAILNPAFAEKEIERVRKTRLGELEEEKSDSQSVADRVLTLVLNGAASPYGYPETGTPASIAAISSSDLLGFWSEHIVPTNAALIVSGDLTQDELKDMLEKAFGKWTVRSPESKVVPVPVPALPRIVLVNMPGASQTQMRVATPGPARSTPDYAPLQVLNALLGGSFTSRINMNLREQRGYTYGAFSGFTYLRDRGWFSVSSAVRTDVTAPAIREVLGELSRIGGAAPATDEETSRARDLIVKALPARFETSEQTTAALTSVYVYGLGLDYFSGYAAKVAAVSPGTLAEMAKKYLVADKLTVLAVGDEARIAGELKKLGLGEIEVRDTEGAVIPRK